MLLILAGSSARRRNYWRMFLPDLLACGLCPPYWVARAPGCDRAPRAPDSFIKVGVGESGRMWRHAHKDGWRPQGCDVKKPRQERGDSLPHVWIQFLKNMFYNSKLSPIKRTLNFRLPVFLDFLSNLNFSPPEIWIFLRIWILLVASLKTLKKFVKIIYSQFNLLGSYIYI